MSPPLPLRAICVKRMCSLLIKGAWDQCEKNPFSFMPPTVVRDLLSYMWPAESVLDTASIANSQLLLKSGRLEDVAVPKSVKSEADYVMLLRMLSRGCQNLRTLSVLTKPIDEHNSLRVGETIDAQEALERLLQNCAKLEHLHSCYINPNALRKCYKLKTVKLHTDRAETERFSCCVIPDLLQSFRFLEVFALCMLPCYPPGEEELGVTRALLDNCPQLTSLGYRESSAALQELHDTDLMTLGTPRRFQMRRCHWVCKKRNSSGSCDRIRVAALSCPLVEVLAIEVHSLGDLQHLKLLRNLTFLLIHFYGCDDYGQEFYSLLDEIGPQLRHLVVLGCDSKPLSLDAICTNCPNLNTLDLDCPTTTDESARPCINLLKLERLRMHSCNSKSLSFLLANSLHLKVLCLDSCRKLEDGTMQAILRKNSFTELRVALIGKCSLSESGCRRFVQSAVKLSKCFLRTYLLGDDEVRRCVRDVNPSVVCHFESPFFELAREQFPQDEYNICWL